MRNGKPDTPLVDISWWADRLESATKTAKLLDDGYQAGIVSADTYVQLNRSAMRQVEIVHERLREVVTQT